MKLTSSRRGAALFNKGFGNTIVVLGDVMLDEFVWGRVSRISPEAPVPVVEITRESFHLGGAANVAHNLHELGANPLLIGVQGKDDAARHLRHVVQDIGISDENLVDDPTRPTTVKTRIIAHNQQVVRTDRESRHDISTEVEGQVLEKLRGAVPRAAALVLSDYSKGILTPRVLEGATALARRRRIPILVDPKLRRFTEYQRVNLVKPNIRETEEATGISVDEPEGLERAAKEILSLLHAKAVLITRGERGMSLFEKRKAPVHISAAAREVFDVTGAGDTVIATAALVIAAGGSLFEATVLANQAAGIVVGKLGTATTKPEEIIQSLRQSLRQSPR